jgi:hypothetical protein
MQRSRQAALVLAAVAVAAATAGAALPGERVLVVEDAETGEQYLTVPVADGATVALEYTHSVEQSRVYEAYTVRGDVLELTRMEFESYGWGLPAGADVTEENGTFVYDPPGNATRLTVAPGRVAGHELHVDDATYDLVALTDAASVDVHLARRTPLTETIETIHG